MTPMRTTVRRALKIVVAVTGVALAAGTTYQGVATALERRDFPAPGPRISVGDHQLHLTCIGDGLPIVVLEAPEAGNSDMCSRPWGRGRASARMTGQVWAGVRPAGWPLTRAGSPRNCMRCC